jgi:hypothetical protein
VKSAMPKIKKAATRRTSPGRTAMGHVAFPGGDKAFRTPDSMTAPDQAFTTAMAQPQGGAPAAPAPPQLPTVQG